VDSLERVGVVSVSGPGLAAVRAERIAVSCVSVSGRCSVRQGPAEVRGSRSEVSHGGRVTNSRRETVRRETAREARSDSRAGADLLLRRVTPRATLGPFAHSFGDSCLLPHSSFSRAQRSATLTLRSAAREGSAVRTSAEGAAAAPQLQAQRAAAAARGACVFVVRWIVNIGKPGYSVRGQCGKMSSWDRFTPGAVAQGTQLDMPLS
jgi:hypothetical protein